jgi:SPP1 family holin
MGIDKPSLTRVIIAVFVIINNILLVNGYNPINDETINAVITIAGNVYLLWPVFKNNYLTKKGQLQQLALQKQKLAKK